MEKFLDEWLLLRLRRVCAEIQLLKGKSSNKKCQISISTNCSMDTHPLHIQETDHFMKMHSLEEKEKKIWTTADKMYSP